jgi:TonB family protein
MTRSTYRCLLLALAATGLWGATSGLWGQESASPGKQTHQQPDVDGVYYPGPEVSTPRMLTTVQALYPSGQSPKDIQGMTAFAMVIDAKGVPQHIQTLHSHGDAFDQAATAALRHSTFEPGKLNGVPVPVWIDVRVVFHADRSQAVPQVLIAERDLPSPDEARLEDKHHRPLSYTPPYPIHTVDADFADPFTNHPYVQVAIVTVQVGKDGMPESVRVSRGLGFGLDEKAAAAVKHYRFLPATSKGKPVSATTNIQVPFSEF